MISIPDRIFNSAEHLAKRLGVSRNQLYSEAVDAFIEKYRSCSVTEQLDIFFEINPRESSLLQDLEELQSQSLGGEKW